MKELSLAQINWLRMCSQRLNQIAEPTPSVSSILRVVCGVQAQEAHSAALALRARGQGLTLPDVESAQAEGRIVRTWLMRGTLHLVAAADLGWLLPLFGPPFIRKSRHRYAQLGLDEETCRRAVGLIEEVLLAKGPLTRSEIASHLSTKGVSSEGQAAYHLVRRAALEGRVCYGPDREGKHTFVALDGWIPVGEAMEPVDAEAELARRYLNAFAPAGPEDMAHWSGLRLTMARRAFKRIEGELEEVQFEGRSGWIPKDRMEWSESSTHLTSVTLLPGYDPLLLGYRDRNLLVATQYVKRVHPGGGLLRPTLLVDGQVAGTWRLVRKRRSVSIQVKPFDRLDHDALSGLEDEVREVGYFLGEESNLMLETAWS